MWNSLLSIFALRRSEYKDCGLCVLAKLLHPPYKHSQPTIPLFAVTKSIVFVEMVKCNPYQPL